MSDAERIAREAHDVMWKHSHFRPDGMVERALIDAARRGIEFGRSQGCTAVEREFIEARMALEPLKLWYNPDECRGTDRWAIAFDALVAERKPKPKWRVSDCDPHIAVSTAGDRRAYWKNDALTRDPETCAREVERLNAEVK